MTSEKVWLQKHRKLVLYKDLVVYGIFCPDGGYIGFYVRWLPRSYPNLYAVVFLKILCPYI